MEIQNILPNDNKSINDKGTHPVIKMRRRLAGFNREMRYLDMFVIKRYCRSINSSPSSAAYMRLWTCVSIGSDNGFIHENASENIIGEMMSILSGGNELKWAPCKESNWLKTSRPLSTVFANGLM